MGRYRPPPPPRSKYITPAGKARLQDELNYLWRVKRPEVTRAVSEAAALGDRSENAEYIYGKKQLREIDSRVRFLQKRIDQVEVVANVPQDMSKVYFGAWITLENDNGEEVEYRIVGADEFDHEPNYISIDSPLAQACLKKGLQEEISVSLPTGDQVYCILSIRYR